VRAAFSATHAITQVVLTHADEKRARLNESCARVRPFDRAHIDASQARRQTSHVTVGNHRECMNKFA